MSKNASPIHVTDFRHRRVDGYTGLAGLGAFVAVLWFAVTGGWAPLHAALAAIAALALVVGVLELAFAKAHRRPSAGLVWDRSARFSGQRVATKCLGLAASLALVAMGYWLLPEYQGAFYAEVWRAARLALWASPLLVPLLILYIGFVDGRMKQPQDGLYAAGRSVLTLGRERDVPALKQLGLALLIKGFFTPLMLVYLCGNIGDMQNLNAPSQWSKGQWFDVVWLLLFTIDLGFCTAGYLCSFRLLDTHIRSSEPTTTGWLAALVCYQPFWSIIGTTYLAYERPWTWGSVLIEHDVAYGVMGAAILLLSGVYAASTVCFGLRFSNLTYRGTVSWGPYRWTKHPAYIFKNASWWLIALPFLPLAGWATALQGCVLLLLLNGIYYVRAKTEERHLMAYPEYRAYAGWIAEHGVLARLSAVAGRRRSHASR